MLSDAMPELSEELRSLLKKVGEPHLAGQVSQLRIVDRCRCGDEFCSTFYTAPRPNDAWGEGHRNISLDCETGMLILDVVNDEITCVEVLDRKEVQQKLNDILRK